MARAWEDEGEQKAERSECEEEEKVRHAYALRSSTTSAVYVGVIACDTYDFSSMVASQSRQAWNMLEFREIGGIEKAESMMKDVVGECDESRRNHVG